MAPKGKLHSVKAFSSTAAETALRIAGISFGYDHQKNVSSEETITIPSNSIENAIQIMNFYLEEALRIHSQFFTMNMQWHVVEVCAKQLGKAQMKYESYHFF